MTMATDITNFAKPEDAYWGFFRADSAKNAVAWANVMSYPHVRVSARGRFHYFDTPEEYAADADWTAREATGWVRSQGRDPVRLHESADKVHLLGGWTRYNADNEPILSNHVTYILTKPGDFWGIQARFATESFSGSDDGEAANAATALVRQFGEDLNHGNLGACASLCRYPFVQVGIGEVRKIEDAAGLQEMLSTVPARTMTSVDVQAAESATHGVIVALTTAYETGDSEHTLMIVGKQESSWQIAGASTMVASP